MQRSTAAWLVRWRWATFFDVTESDATLVQVVWGHFQCHTVTRDDADVVFLHFAGGVSDQLVTVVEIDTEAHFRQDFRDETIHFDQFFFSHIPFRLVPAWRGRCCGNG